eukprot:9505391-Karenia_brevis.AAC.1
MAHPFGFFVSSVQEIDPSKLLLLQVTEKVQDGGRVVDVRGGLTQARTIGMAEITGVYRRLLCVESSETARDFLGL